MKAITQNHTAWLLGWCVLFWLGFSGAAQATAPRVAPRMFGEEKKADILQYRLEANNAAVAAEDKLLAELVTASFAAVEKAPRLDRQPARQLAKYALFNGEVAALIGSPQDFADKEKKRYRIIVFYLRGGKADGAEVALIFPKSHASGDELSKAFDAGLRKLIASGKYLELLETSHGKGTLPADYVDSLKRHHPDWK